MINHICAENQATGEVKIDALYAKVWLVLFERNVQYNHFFSYEINPSKIHRCEKGANNLLVNNEHVRII
jgi:hypothetical protein